MVMGGLYYKVHGLRLAQAREMQLDLKADRPHSAGRPARIHMQLDGEPWQQELPSAQTEPPLHVGTTESCQSHGLSVAVADAQSDELGVVWETFCLDSSGHLQTLTTNVGCNCLPCLVIAS